jgi:hypothetical protein
LGSGGSGGSGGEPGEPEIHGMDGAVTASFTEIGLLGWTVPAMVVGIPGLLVLIVVALQAFGAAAWLPVARRNLGGREGSGRR